MDPDIKHILHFWFGPLDGAGMPSAEKHQLWFKRSEHTDIQCQIHFGKLVEQALAGELQHWEQSDEGLIALIVLLDQFTRNIYRGTARAFAGDARALSLAKARINSSALGGISTGGTNLPSGNWNGRLSKVSQCPTFCQVDGPEITHESSNPTPARSASRASRYASDFSVEPGSDSPPGRT